MTSFKLTICDVTNNMHTCHTLCKRIRDKFPSLDLSTASYEKSKHSSVYIYYCPEEHIMRIEGSSNRYLEGPDVVSYKNTISDSALYSYEYIIEWVERIRETYKNKQTESYNVF